MYELDKNLDFLNIGSTPPDEPCAQLGEEHYRKRSRLEIEAYKRLLKRQFPFGLFSGKSFPHDFGTYYEVVAWFHVRHENEEEEENCPLCKAAFEAESSSPLNWDEEAKKELKEAGYFD